MHSFILNTASVLQLKEKWISLVITALARYTDCPRSIRRKGGMYETRFWCIAKILLKAESNHIQLLTHCNVTYIIQTIYRYSIAWIYLK